MICNGVPYKRCNFCHAQKFLCVPIQPLSSEVWFWSIFALRLPPLSHAQRFISAFLAQEALALKKRQNTLHNRIRQLSGEEKDIQDGLDKFIELLITSRSNLEKIEAEIEQETAGVSDINNDLLNITFRPTFILKISYRTTAL